MNLRSRFSLLLALALVACGPAAVHPAPAPDQASHPPVTGAAGPVVAKPAPVIDRLDARLPLLPAIRTGKLPNGLTYFVLSHHEPKARAQLWLAVNAGSLQEDDDQRGLAHLIEHMAFNGTKRFPHQAIVDYLEKSGMRFGADVNASTSFDETIYQLTVPTDDKKVMLTGLDVLRDWAGDISFDQVELDKERGVVLEEWRLGRGAFMRLFDKQADTLYGPGYAKRLPIGLPEIIKKASRDTLLRFYKDWYRPDLMAVFVVGDVDTDELEAAVKQRFGDLAGPAKERDRTVTPVPHDLDLQVTVDTDPEMPRTNISIYDKVAHQPEHSMRDYRRTLVEALYNQMLNQRFEQIARTPGAPFLFAGSGTNDIGRDADALVRFASAQAGHAEEALKGLFTEVLRVERHGFSAGELERAKKDVMRGFEVGYKERDKADSRELVDEATRYFLTDEMMPGREAELAIAKELLPGITLAEVNELAHSTGDKGRAILVSGPAKAPIPSKEKVIELVHGVAATQVEAWNDTPPPTTLMAKTPTPGKVKATRTIDELGVTEWTLENGIKVVVKPTDFKNDEVQMVAISPGGTSLVADKDFESARFATAAVNGGGVGDMDASTLERALAGKVVQLNTFIGELEEGAFGRSSPDDLETMLQLTYLRFTAPRKDEAAFTTWKTSMRDRAANRRLDPQGAFFEDMDSFISQKHPRHAPVTPEVVDKVNLDRALAIYKDRFGDAGDFTFVLVGNVDLKLLQPLVETYLGSLPTKHRKEKWKDIGVHFPSGKKELEVKLGSEPKSTVFYTRNARQPWSKDVERDLEILRRLLEIRLREVLREDMSGVYGVRVSTYVTRRPRQERTFLVSFGCDPANVIKLRDAVVATVATIQKEGLGEEYLAKVRELIVRGHETDLRDNRFWLGRLVDAWRFGDDPRDLLEVKPLLDRVTLANVKAAAKKYLDSKDSVLAVLRPADAPAAPAPAPAAPAAPAPAPSK